MHMPPPPLHVTRAPQEHLLGKQYLGWKRIRETHAALTKVGARCCCCCRSWTRSTPGNSIRAGRGSGKPMLS
jgi:hypothetical protein